MKVSLTLAQYYSSADLTALSLPDLLQKIGAQLGAVEEVVEWGPRYEGIWVAKVVSCQKHEGADKLSVCLVDDGKSVENVERNEKGLVQVVCGAPNVREGLSVAWIPPGTVVPSTIDKDPFTLETREIRGIKSNGMLASPAELGISDNHEGILEITAEEAGEEALKPGTPLKALFGLDDIVVDLENKMFTHRPDCFGILGVTRELAGIDGQEFKSPDWYLEDPKFDKADDFPLRTQIDTALSPRFSAVAMKGVSIAPSPIWVQAALTRMGIKPINNVVDTTNFVMQVTGQPLHAFDYDKLKSRSDGDVVLGPRLARKGEKLNLLNGKTIELSEEDMVIATNQEVVALAGIMGGADTEVDESTKNIVIESACFDMYAVRRSSMRHGLFTDAVTRFTKGQSPLQTTRVLRHAVRLLEGSGASLASEMCDEGAFASEKPAVETDSSFINQRLGSDLNADDMAKLLKNVEFEVNVKDEKLKVMPPFWRMDIDEPEDLVEEIGRLHNFDKLPVVLPARTLRPPKRNELLDIKSRIRYSLAAYGANEVLTYGFVHGKLLANIGQNPDEAYSLRNALSPDLQHYRLTLTPSLLEKVHPNIKAGADSFALFEIGRTHVKMHGQTDENVPKELEMTSLVVAASDKASENRDAAYFEARRILDFLANQLGFVLRYERLSEAPPYEVCKPYDWQRSALVYAEGSDVFIGIIGEPSAAARKALKLPRFTAAFELGTEGLLEASSMTAYEQTSRFPSSQQDITLEVAKEVDFAAVSSSVRAGLGAATAEQGYVAAMEPLDIFETDTSIRYTFRLSVSHPDKTLRTEEVSAIVEAIEKKAAADVHATRI